MAFTEADQNKNLSRGPQTYRTYIFRSAVNIVTELEIYCEALLNDENGEWQR